MNLSERWTNSTHDDSAVYIQTDPGDIRGIIRGQKQGGIRDIHGLAESA
jgi:hypothetical protein